MEIEPASKAGTFVRTEHGGGLSTRALASRKSWATGQRDVGKPNDTEWGGMGRTQEPSPGREAITDMLRMIRRRHQTRQGC